MSPWIAVGIALASVGADTGQRDDDTLRLLLEKSDLVVVAEHTQGGSSIGSEDIVWSTPSRLRVIEVLKGNKPDGATVDISVVRYGQDVQDIASLTVGTKYIYFLKDHGYEGLNGHDHYYIWTTADIWCGVQKASPWMVKSIKRIVAETAEADQWAEREQADRGGTPKRVVKESPRTAVPPRRRLGPPNVTASDPQRK